MPLTARASQVSLASDAGRIKLIVLQGAASSNSASSALAGEFEATKRSQAACAARNGSALGSCTKLPGHIAIAAYRVTQEALSNVLKHSRAKSAVVRVANGGDATMALEIIDDGTGFDIHTRTSGLGLIGIRERVAAWHGIVEWASSARGTQVKVLLPTKAQDQAAQ